MTEYLEGGRRRLDRVLAPDFVAGIEGMDDDELLSRRADAEQEETDLSYARRLLQGRLDLLRAEAGRRSGGADEAAEGSRTDDQLVAQLTQALAGEPGAPAGAPHFVTAEPSRVGEHRRVVEAVIADVELSDARHLDDARLEAATSRLAAMEHELSGTRASVQQVLDRLTDAVAARVRRA